MTPVNRAEAAKLVANAFGFSDNSGSLSFADVDLNAWYYYFILFFNIKIFFFIICFKNKIVLIFFIISSIFRHLYL